MDGAGWFQPTLFWWGYSGFLLCGVLSVGGLCGSLVTRALCTRLWVWLVLGRVALGEPGGLLLLCPPVGLPQLGAVSGVGGSGPLLFRGFVGYSGGLGHDLLAAWDWEDGVAAPHFNYLKHPL